MILARSTATIRAQNWFAVAILTPGPSLGPSAGAFCLRPMKSRTCGIPRAHSVLLPV